MNRALLAALLFASTAVHAQAPACASWGKPGKLLYADDFRGGLGQWVAEYAMPGSAVSAGGGKLVIDVAGGATVWFRHKLSGNVLISYRRKVIMEQGRNDRLSDLNNFWMASDPANPNLFTRGGAFSEYDSLSMYYTGMGGNRNTTTRFRRYGGGDRVLLGDLTDAAHLLQPNRDYAIQIAVYRGCTRMLVDGKPYFSYADPAPLREGHFGLRTTQSRHQIEDFEVRQLDAEE
jgi:rhamnogalacturonan endolyase